MNKPLFDNIGKTYNNTRAADSRIVDVLASLLNLSANQIIADIGAGSGNYSYALAEKGYRIRAIEPSVAMRNQAQYCSRVEWHSGFAENVPLETGSVDGVISILANHHFSDCKKAFQEMARISQGGPIVIFTFDPRSGQETWINSYFPTIWEDAFKVFPPISDIAQLLEISTGQTIEVFPFHVPKDIKDNFAAAGWCNPHLYLNPAYRENMSPFRLADQDLIMKGVNNLQEDLSSGAWQQNYGNILHKSEIDAGYRLIKALPKS